MTDEQHPPQPEGEVSRTDLHPMIKRLERQARQFDHAANTAESEHAENILRQQHTFIRAMIVLGKTPAAWEDLVADMFEANVAILAQVVAAGYAQLPPAEVDHE